MSILVDFTDADVSVLIKILKRIDSDITITSDVINEGSHQLIKTAIKLADEYLTGDENFGNIITVREAGFHVYAAEQDRFGWLVGAIRLKRGTLYFG